MEALSDPYPEEAHRTVVIGTGLAGVNPFGPPSTNGSTIRDYETVTIIPRSQHATPCVPLCTCQEVDFWHGPLAFSTFPIEFNVQPWVPHITDGISFTMASFPKTPPAISPIPGARDEANVARRIDPAFWAPRSPL